jgi:hypothetical protein
VTLIEAKIKRERKRLKLSWRLCQALPHRPPAESECCRRSGRVTSLVVPASELLEAGLFRSTLPIGKLPGAVGEIVLVGNEPMLVVDLDLRPILRDRRAPVVPATRDGGSRSSRPHTSVSISPPAVWADRRLAPTRSAAAIEASGRRARTSTAWRKINRALARTRA